MIQSGHVQCVHKVLWGQCKEAVALVWWQGFRKARLKRWRILREGNSAERGRRLSGLARWDLWKRPWEEMVQRCLGALLTVPAPLLTCYQISQLATTHSILGFYGASSGKVGIIVSLAHRAPRGKPYGPFVSICPECWVLWCVVTMLAHHYFRKPWWFLSLA